MIALPNSKKLVLTSTFLSIILSVPFWAHADITGFNDPALLQARQAYQSALQNQTATQQAIAPALASQQTAAAAASDAQTRANFANGNLQNLISQVGGDEDALRQQRDRLNADLQRAISEIPQIQSNRIPSLNQAIANLSASLANAQSVIPLKQTVLDQTRHALEKAGNEVAQAQAALQGAQQSQTQDEAAVQGAQRTFNDAQSQVNAAQAQLAGATDLENRATAQVDALNAGIQSTQAQISAAQAEVAKNNANIQTWAAVKPADPNYKNAQAQLKAAQAQNGGLNHEIAASQQKLSADQSALPGAMSQLSQTQNSIAQDNQKIVATNQQKAGAQQALTLAQGNLQQQQQVVAPLRATLDQKNAQLAAVQAALNTAQTDLNAANGTVAVDQSQIAGANHQLQQAGADLQHDLDIQANAPQRLVDLNDKVRRLHEAHQQFDHAQGDLQQALAALQNAQSVLDNANVQNQNATGLVQAAQAQLDNVTSSEAIVYLQGAGGIGLAERYRETSHELSPALSGPNPSASGLTIYAPGVSILWGSQNGTYVGSEAIILRSSTSPASSASNLQGYGGTLSVPAFGGLNPLTLGAGAMVNMGGTDPVAGHALITLLFNALEPQGGLTTGNAVDCASRNLCQIQNMNGNLVLVLPNSIFVLAPVAPSADGSANYVVQTIALLNMENLEITQDLASVISVVSAQ